MQTDRYSHHNTAVACLCPVSCFCCLCHSVVVAQIALTAPIIWSSKRQGRPETKMLMAWEQQYLLAANDTGAVLQPPNKVNLDP